MAVFNPFDFFLEPAAEQYPFSYDADLARELRPFLEIEPAGPALLFLLEQSAARRASAPSIFWWGSTSSCKTEIGYVIRMEPGVQTCEQTLSLGTGSCRDSAWLLVQVLRNLGLAARFVSGLSDSARGRRKAASRDPPDRPPISPTCTRGPKCICRARDGSDSIPLPECSPEKATFRWPARRTPAAPLRSRACSIRAIPNSATR